MAKTPKRQDYKKQDEKFVEWSREVTEESFDLKHIIEFLKNQVNTSEKALPQFDHPLRLLDVGGGIGSVAMVLSQALGAQVDVIDPSPLARENFVESPGTRFYFGDYLKCDLPAAYDAILFRTVLHHFVGAGFAETRRRQTDGLAKAKQLLKPNGLQRIVVVENFYEPYLHQDITGQIIYAITALSHLEALTRRLGANTAGEGVRFRSLASWRGLFSQQSLHIEKFWRDPDWGERMPLWQQLPLVCDQRFQGTLILSERSEQSN